MSNKYLLILILFISSSAISQNIDINLLRDINLGRNKSLDKSFLFITKSDAPVCFSTPIIIVATGILTNNKITTQQGIVTGASIMVAGSVTTIMKYGFKRKRPFITYPDIDKQTDAGSPSFPSGHTSIAFATATSLSLAYPKWYVIAPSYAYASAVAYSRMHLGVHYPSDVLVGMILGSASSFLCYKAQKWVSVK